MPGTGQLSPGEHLVSGIVLEATPMGVQCSGGGGSDCLTARRCLGRLSSPRLRNQSKMTHLDFLGFRRIFWLKFSTSSYNLTCIARIDANAKIEHSSYVTGL